MDAATTEFYPLSLHDALPICVRQDVAGRLGTAAGGQPVVDAEVDGDHDRQRREVRPARGLRRATLRLGDLDGGDRKSTRLNSSHSSISYAVFCLKKKKRTAND